MLVQDIATFNVICCVPATSLPSVAQMMIENECGAIPVVDGNEGLRPLGIVTDRDITCRIVAHGYLLSEITAADCMSAPAHTIRLTASVDELCQTMEHHRVRRLLVVDSSGACRGMVSVTDLIRHDLGDRATTILKLLTQPMATVA